MTRYLCAAMYIAAGITTAAAVKEVHYQVCTPEWIPVYVAIGAVWPVTGALMLAADPAPSRCEAHQ